jgi:hypothetical protein
MRYDGWLIRYVPNMQCARRLPELFDPQFSSLVTQLLCRAEICQWHEFDVQYRGCEIFNARMWQDVRSSIDSTT